MKFLGLDISTNSTGWAVLDDDTPEEYGIITTTGDGLVKLDNFYRQLENILSDIDHLDWVAIEDTYIQNAVTTKILSRYCGAAMVAVYSRFRIESIFHLKDFHEIQRRLKSPRAKAKIPTAGVYMPAPSEVFGVLGIPYPKDREIKKQTAIDWVKENLYIDLKREQDDIADAILLAFAVKEQVNKLTP